MRGFEVRPMNRRVVLILAVAASGAPGVSMAQEQEADTDDVELRRFINPDTREVLPKLEVLRHALDETNQRLVNLTFVQLHGDEVEFEPVRYANYDGDLVPGYVFTPKELDRSRKHPALVAVHGGYHGHFAESDFDRMVRMVKEGYVVIFPEYRGSRGYGAEHYNAIDYGGEEVSDVLAAADYLVERKPYVDGNRLGIIGRSHGGMIALLAIQRAPEKFRAAVDVVGMTDFVAYMSYKPEYRRQDVAREPRFSGLPFENLEAYVEVSPINHVEKIRTPLLVLATTGDRIVPLELHTGRLLDALQARGKEFESHIYENAPGGHIYVHGDTDVTDDHWNRVFRFLAQHLR